jgi:hypothetical protein
MISGAFDGGRTAAGPFDGDIERLGAAFGAALRAALAEALGAFFAALAWESSHDFGGDQIFGRTAVSPQFGQNALRSVVLTSNRAPQRLQSMFTAAALCLGWRAFAMKRSSAACRGRRM